MAALGPAAHLEGLAAVQVVDLVPHRDVEVRFVGRAAVLLDGMGIYGTEHTRRQQVHGQHPEDGKEKDLLYNYIIYYNIIYTGLQRENRILV